MRGLVGFSVPGRLVGQPYLMSNAIKVHTEHTNLASTSHATSDGLARLAGLRLASLGDISP